MKTNKIVITATLASLSMLVSCSADAPSTPRHETHFTAATAPLPYLLPEGTLLAVEIHDLARRWPEIRAVPPLARFQDLLLAEMGLDSDDLPLLVGDRCVLALVFAAGGRAVVPVALLLPPSAEQAQAIVGSLADTWTLVRARGALWIGPKGLTHELEMVALGDGTSLAEAVPMDEVSQRLPTGGLVRGWINPAALQQLLQRRIEGRLSAMVDVAGGFLSAELEAVRWIGFRRELESAKIVTDAVVVYDTGVLPPEVSRIFNPDTSSPRLPAVLPNDVVVAAAFRPESGASLAWLRYVAQRNATNSLRHLEFWIDEFEERFGRNLEADLFDLIGEHGWFLGWETESDMPPTWVLVLQTADASRVEATLLDLLSWSNEHAWARTLGLAVPRITDYKLDGTTVHAVALRTPFGQLAGPVFAAVEGYVVTGSHESTLRTGVTLVENGTFSSRASNQEESIRAHASLWARGPAIAGWVESTLTLSDGNSNHTALIGAVAGLIAGFVSAAARAWYEEDALRMHSEIMLDGLE